MIVALLFAKDDNSLVLFRHTAFFKKMRKTFKLMRKGREKVDEKKVGQGRLRF
jgi:hypothetical protein